MRGVLHLNQHSNELIIRHFQQEDMPLLGELYRAVTATEYVLFWWVGPEQNWINVYCAIENGKMIAKGQVEIINVVPDNRQQESKNTIFVNLKTVPERENDRALLDKMYEQLFKRAKQLKDSLNSQYGTLLCVGNYSTETANNQFFKDKGYHYFISLFGMTRHLIHPIPHIKLHADIEFSHWKMDTAEEIQHYLDLDYEIWPDNPIGYERLIDNKNNKLWTSMVLRQEKTIIGGLMVWQENDDEGVIEDVFIRKPWRRLGFAKYLLSQALQYLEEHHLQVANLTVLTTNESALSLYKSIGFNITSEEIRYCIELD